MRACLMASLITLAVLVGLPWLGWLLHRHPAWQSWLIEAFPLVCWTFVCGLLWWICPQRFKRKRLKVLKIPKQPGDRIESRGGIGYLIRDGHYLSAGMHSVVDCGDRWEIK